MHWHMLIVVTMHAFMTGTFVAASHSYSHNILIIAVMHALRLHSSR